MVQLVYAPIIMDKQEKNIPNHVAVIMDGNGRWAQKQDKPRKFGHEEGMEAIREGDHESK